MVIARMCRVVTDEGILTAKATELDEAEAFRIVLSLAKRNITQGHTLTVEHKANCGVRHSRGVRYQAAMSR
jgi:hypothetical protein